LAVLLYLLVHRVDESRVVARQIDEREGVHFLHESLVSLVRGLAGRAERACDFGRFLGVALHHQLVHLGVGRREARHERGQPERGVLARESTVSPADVHAVIRALPEVMADFMKESRAVHLEGVGYFRYSILASGNGVAKKEAVSSDQIKGIRVQFTPDRTKNTGGEGYTRALIAEDGLTFMEWLGKDSDATEVEDETEGETT